MTENYQVLSFKGSQERGKTTPSQVYGIAGIFDHTPDDSCQTDLFCNFPHLQHACGMVVASWS